MQPGQAGNGEPLANLDRLAWAQAIGLQAQVPGPRLAAGGDQDLVAPDLLPVAQGHGDLRADPEDRDSPHAGPHIDSAAGQRLQQLLGRERLPPGAAGVHWPR